MNNTKDEKNRENTTLARTTTTTRMPRYRFHNFCLHADTDFEAGA